MRFTFMVLFIWWTLIERDQKGPSFLTFSPPSLGEVMLVWSKSSRTATWINLAYSGHSIKYIQYIQVVCANILYIYINVILYISHICMACQQGWIPIGDSKFQPPRWGRPIHLCRTCGFGPHRRHVLPSCRHWKVPHEGIEGLKEGLWL